MVIVSDILLPKNTNGVLQVETTNSSVGGDATATNQLAMLTSLQSLDSKTPQLESSSGNELKVAVIPADNTNSGITDDPANSIAVGLRARTNIAQASTETFIACDATGALIVRADNSNDSIRIVGQNSSGSNKGVGVEDTDGAVLSGGKVVVADPNSSDGSRQVLRLNRKNELLTFGDNLYKQVFTNEGIANGQGEISPSLTMNNGGGSNVEVYINYGGASGATASDFSFTIQESWDGTDFFLNSSANFSQVLQNVNAITPKAVKTGMIQFDARFLKISVSNNSGAIQTINAYVYAKRC